MVEKRPLTYPLTVNTIGILIDADYAAFLSCRSCGMRDIDLHKLAEKVGRIGTSSVDAGPLNAICGNRRLR